MRSDRKQAAVQLKKLRKETLSALDQMPLSIEKAEFFMRMYGYPQVNQQMENLYVAIIDALQHILEWYKRAAGSESSYPAQVQRLFLLINTSEIS